MGRESSEKEARKRAWKRLRKNKSSARIIFACTAALVFCCYVWFSGKRGNQGTGDVHGNEYDAAAGSFRRKLLQNDGNGTTLESSTTTMFSTTTEGSTSTASSEPATTFSSSSAESSSSPASTEPATFSSTSEISTSTWTGSSSSTSGGDSSSTPAHPNTTEEAPCQHSSLDEFPDDFLTREQRQKGGVIIHILISLYLFVGLAIACDDYFVESLEILSEALDMSSDVAGATFMAAGSSAPEFFTSVIGVFIAEGDIGVSTIMGSAVFNIAGILCICCFFAGMVVYLTPWPLIRDTIAYFITVLALVLTLIDEEVFWYEGLIFCLLYCLYVGLMKFNSRMLNWLQDRYAFFRTNVGFDDDKDAESQSLLLEDEEVFPRSRANTGEFPYKRNISKTTSVFSVTSQSSIFRRSNTHTRGGGYQSDSEAIFHQTGALKKTLQESQDGSAITPGQPTPHVTVEDVPLHSDVDSDTKSEYRSPLTVPDTTGKRIFWAVMLPCTLLYYFTIPDCRRGPKWRKYYMATFIMSVVWIAAFSYVLVWMVSLIGDTFGIPDTVMGLTLLAAGTSVPDAVASLIVARDGFGDMALSNVIGSNVFDILACLGVPWLIRTLTSGDLAEPVPIRSSGLTYSSMTLLATVVFVFVAIVANRWRLTKKLGVFCFLFYVVFLTFSVMYETNVFGEFTLPPCPRAE